MTKYYLLWMGLWDAPGVERSAENLEHLCFASYETADEAYSHLLAMDTAVKDDYVLVIKSDLGEREKHQDVLHKKLSEAQPFIKEHILKQTKH